MERTGYRVNGRRLVFSFARFRSIRTLILFLLVFPTEIFVRAIARSYQNVSEVGIGMQKNIYLPKAPFASLHPSQFDKV